MLGIVQAEGQVREENLLISDRLVSICLQKAYLPLCNSVISTILGISLLLWVIYNVCCYNLH